MCGFVGSFYKRESGLDFNLKYLAQLIRHRGPDDQGIVVQGYGDCKYEIAFNRLAIIDLTKGGHQPMVNSTLGVSVLFNWPLTHF